MARPMRSLEVKSEITGAGQEQIKKMIITMVHHSSGKTEVMKEAHDKLKNNSLPFYVQWKKYDVLLEKLRGEDGDSVNGVIITEEFSGPLFEALKANPRIRVFGPLVIFDILRDPHKPECLPSTSPIVSLAMKHLIIAVSGIPNKDQIIDHIKMLGGKVRPELSKNTMYVIAENLTTKKCQFARQYKIPIVHPRFVTECWDMSIRNEMVNARALAVQRRLPVFSGFVISATQADVEQRECFSKNTKKYGYEWKAALLRDKTTHLLCQRPEGDKFDNALKWGDIHIVSFKWFEDSIEAGYALPEKKYYISAGNSQTSRTVKEKVPVASNKSPRYDHTNKVASSQLVNESTIESSSGRYGGSSSQSSAKKPLQKLGAHQPLATIYSHLLLTQTNLLDGLQFMFVGFGPEDTKFLQKLVVYHSGITSVTMRDTVTHLIVGAGTSEGDAFSLQYEMHTKNVTCNILKKDWLMACFEKKSLVPTTGYLSSKIPQGRVESKKSAHKEERLPQAALGFTVAKKNTDVAKKAISYTMVTSTPAVPTQELVGDDDLLTQYSGGVGTRNPERAAQNVNNTTPIMPTVQNSSRLSSAAPPIHRPEPATLHSRTPNAAPDESERENKNIMNSRSQRLPIRQFSQETFMFESPISTTTASAAPVVRCSTRDASTSVPLDTSLKRKDELLSAINLPTQKNPTVSSTEEEEAAREARNNSTDDDVMEVDVVQLPRSTRKAPARKNTKAPPKKRTCKKL